MPILSRWRQLTAGRASRTCNSDIVIPHGLSPTVLSEPSCRSLLREFAAPLTGIWRLVCSGIAHIDLHHAGMRTRTQQSGEQLLRSSEETGPTSVRNIGCQCSRRLSQGTVPRWNRQLPCLIGRQKNCSQFVKRSPDAGPASASNLATEDRQLDDSSPVICGVTAKASDDTAAAL